MKAFANTFTATWLDECVNLYPNNYLAGQDNEDHNGKLDSEVVVIKIVTKIKKHIFVPNIYLITLVSLKLSTYLQN